MTSLNFFVNEEDMYYYVVIVWAFILQLNKYITITNIIKDRNICHKNKFTVILIKF